MMENTQILPWIWVIEALASYKSVDTSLLLQLAKTIPDKYGEMGKNAREAVLLRILEGLAARDDEVNDCISDSGERIKFDPSESCEDVLQHILEDVQASDVENGGLKMLKWDVRSFIAGKRARLNSPVLQKLKDAILEGSHSVIESLKERSGIAVRTRNNVSANGGHSDELVQRHEERDKNVEAVESSKTSKFASAEKCDDESQGNVPEQNLLPAKRKRSHVSAEILERQAYHTITAEDCCDPEREAAKKHKQAENCPRHDSVGFTIASSQHEIPVKPSEILVENVEVEVHRSDKEAEPEDIEFVASPNNLEKRQAYDTITTKDCGDTEREAAKRHKQVENCPRHDSVGVTIISSQHEVPKKPSENLVENVETEMHRPAKEADVEDEFVVSPNDMEDQETQLRSPANPVDEDNGKKLSSAVQGQNDKIGEGHRGREGNELRTSNDTLLPVVEVPNTVDKAIEFNHVYHAAGAAETNDHIEHGQDPEATDNSEEYHDETSDMNLMKNAFLSAQCTFSQDSLATQLKKLCTKCNNGGKVLECSSDTCTIAVHESCLGSTVNMDCEGQFYCPFCASSRAMSEYLEVRKRATLARKKLAIFIGQKVDNQKMTEGSDNSKMNEAKRDDNLSKGNVPNNNRASSSRVNRKSSRSNLEDRGKTIPTVPCARDKAPCIQKGIDVACEAPRVSENINRDGENMEQECRLPSRQGVPENVGSLPLKRLEGVVSPDTEKGINDVNGRDTRARGSKKIRKESASPAEALHDPTESYEDESDQSVASTHNIKSKRTPNRQTCQGVLRTRNGRRTVWTPVEVEKLKEGVEKFGNVDGVVPWTKILEYGADVFLKGRTADDLRYKGRAISKQIREQKRSLVS